ncbi:MAG TPA: adenylate kinase [Parachlamydiaceae bacterium]|nr:adenylate kinase [Parachlamydiaceae bacterium]
MIKKTCLVLLSLAILASVFVLKFESPMNILIMLGAPGSGKGTQAVKASKELNIPHISTGDLFRENLKNNTELGKKVRSYMDSGRLVPDDLVLAMLFDRVSKPDCNKGYLLDGFPRTIPQAEALDQHLTTIPGTVTVLNLNCSDESVVKRISGRLTCQGCGHVYNKYFSSPKQEGICDLCSSDLLQRADDKEEIVKERLRVYKDQTEPLISFYRNKNLLKDLDGEKPASQVYQDLITFVKK